ncbi:MAG TPA: hypothetical protein VGQ10_20365 [Vicinamibacterales bacterium]|jgi:hypothetical protein|nr:hypothetical protein [Vicinamibacterales bacterium]
MRFLEKQLEDPVRVKRLARGFYAGLAVLALAEIAAPYVIGTDHAHFGFEDFPAWGSLYGLVSCVAIIVVSKLLGKLWLSRPENYYDR